MCPPARFLVTQLPLLLWALVRCPPAGAFAAEEKKSGASPSDETGEAKSDASTPSPDRGDGCTVASASPPRGLVHRTGLCLPERRGAGRARKRRRSVFEGLPAHLLRAESGGGADAAGQAGDAGAESTLSEVTVHSPSGTVTRRGRINNKPLASVSCGTPRHLLGPGCSRSSRWGGACRRTRHVKK